MPLKEVLAGDCLLTVFVIPANPRANEFTYDTPPSKNRVLGTDGREHKVGRPRQIGVVELNEGPPVF